MDSRPPPSMIFLNIHLKKLYDKPYIVACVLDNWSRFGKPLQFPRQPAIVVFLMHSQLVSTCDFLEVSSGQVEEGQWDELRENR